MNETLTHILYLSDNKPVCDWPARLDHFSDYVLNQRVRPGETACDTCRHLLLQHNLKQNFIEKTKSHDYGIAYVTHKDLDSQAFRGMVYGGLISSFLWAIIIVLFVWKF